MLKIKTIIFGLNDIRRKNTVKRVIIEEKDMTGKKIYTYIVSLAFLTLWF